MKTIEVDELKEKLSEHFLKANKKRHSPLDKYEISYLIQSFGYMGYDVREKYIDDVIIDGEEYEMRACWVGESYWSMFGIPCFLCYSLYREADLQSHTIQEYKECKKLYSLDIDEDDFPSAFFE